METKIITSNVCKPFRHIWSIWSVVTNSKHSYTSMQFKKCLVCGKVKMRVVSKNIKFDTDEVNEALNIKPGVIDNRGKLIVDDTFPEEIRNG